MFTYYVRFPDSLLLFHSHFSTIDGIQYSEATVAFLGPTYRFLCFYGVLPWDSDVLMFLHVEIFYMGVITLKIIVEIFELHFWVRNYMRMWFISYNKFSEWKNSEKLQNNSCRLLFVCCALYTNNYLFNNLWWRHLVDILHHIFRIAFSWRFQWP